LLGQRTQLYGNLWYKNAKKCRPSEWVELDLVNGARSTDEVMQKRDDEFRALQRGDQNTNHTQKIKHRV